MVEQYRANLRFIDVLQHWMNRNLQKYIKQSFNKETCGQIYVDLRDQVNELFSKTSQHFSDVTRTWLSQKLYLSVKVGKPSLIHLKQEDQITMSLPQVFEPVSVSEIPTDELRLLMALISDCDFVDELLFELRKRTH